MNPLKTTLHQMKSLKSKMIQPNIQQSRLNPQPRSHLTLDHGKLILTNLECTRSGHVAFITQYSNLRNLIINQNLIHYKGDGEVVVVVVVEVVVQSVPYACSTHVYIVVREKTCCYITPKGHSTMILGGFLPFNVILSMTASCR